MMIVVLMLMLLMLMALVVLALMMLMLLIMLALDCRLMRAGAHICAMRTACLSPFKRFGFSFFVE
ncbi:MAG: hypothetical protein LBM04_02725 [Opitutaceae bacterium]|nr:hypothetical protein [Opitutaceae bacterium]